MHDEVDWNEVEREARRAVESLSFLVGRWLGTGTDHGEPVRARLVVTPALAGTFLEATEQWLDADGAVTHEDRAFYRWAHDEGRLRVLHLMAPAFSADRVVFTLDDPADTEQGPGIRWDGGPLAPVVRWTSTGPDGLRCSVQHPFTAEPATTVDYRRQG